MTWPLHYSFRTCTNLFYRWKTTSICPFLQKPYNLTIVPLCNLRYMLRDHKGYTALCLFVFPLIFSTAANLFTSILQRRHHYYPFSFPEVKLCHSEEGFYMIVPTQRRNPISRYPNKVQWAYLHKDVIPFTLCLSNMKLYFSDRLLTEGICSAL